MITCSFGKKYKPSLRHVVVDMLVIKGKKIILVKRGKNYIEPNKWALPGGYMEKGETAQQAAVRETLEETGYKTAVVKLLQIVDSPKRRHDYRQSISLVYLMKVIQRVSGFDEEISEIKWFGLDDLPPVKDMAFDHLEMIKKYLNKL